MTGLFSKVVEEQPCTVEQKLTRSHWAQRWNEIELLLPQNDLLKITLALVTPLETGDTLPPSVEFRLYSERVTSQFSKMSLVEARELALNVYVVSMTLKMAKWVALYPVLKEYAGKFSATPELLVTLFTESSTVGDTEKADEYLRRAYRLEPDNKFVLWQLLVAHSAPWFPKDLIQLVDPLTHELSVVGQLLKSNPYDPLALSVESRLKSTRRSLLDRENIQFFNSLSPLIPHPLRNIELEQLL